MQKILVACDGSASSFKACDMALELARRFPGCQLVVLNVAPLSVLDLATYRIPMSGQDLLPAQLEERLTRVSENILAAALERLTGVPPIGGAAGGVTRAGDVPVSTRNVLGHPKDVICELAEEEKFDLVILGSRGHGKLQRVLLGSTTDSVVNHCQCPVLVVRP